MVNHYAPHIPHMSTKEAFERTKKRWIAEGRDTEKIDAEKSSVHRDILYAAMVEEMDMNVGALIDALKAKGQLDNTYFIFTSDNGEGTRGRSKSMGSCAALTVHCKTGNAPSSKGAFVSPPSLPVPESRPVPSVTSRSCSGTSSPLFTTLAGARHRCRKVSKAAVAGVVREGQRRKSSPSGPGHHPPLHLPLSSADQLPHHRRLQTHAPAQLRQNETV